MLVVHLQSKFSDWAMNSTKKSELDQCRTHNIQHFNAGNKFLHEIVELSPMEEEENLLQEYTPHKKHSRRRVKNEWTFLLPISTNTIILIYLRISHTGIIMTLAPTLWLVSFECILTVWFLFSLHHYNFVPFGDTKMKRISIVNDEFVQRNLVII